MLTDVIKFESFVSVNSSMSEFGNNTKESRKPGEESNRRAIQGGKENAGSEQDTEVVVLAPNSARSQAKRKSKIVVLYSSR